MSVTVTTSLPIVTTNACPPRCGKCCVADVMCPREEAIPLAQHLLRDVPRGKLLKQIRFWGHGVPCPWLGAEGRCFVYDWRPTVCRTYPNLDNYGGKCTEGVHFELWDKKESEAGRRALLPRGRETLVAGMGGIARALERCLEKGKTDDVVIEFGPWAMFEKRLHAPCPSR